MLREHHIKVERTARYYTLGPDDGSAAEVWLVLHGYGQLAAQFVRLFETIDDGTRLIVAPEALNRFYVSGVDRVPAAERPVGATWMTREDRDHEIADYLAYLDDVANEVLARFRRALPRVVLLGFSQGTATAGRWLAHGTIRPNHVVLWGGFPPPDVELDAPLGHSSLQIVIGANDRFVTPERLTEEETRLRNAGVSYRVRRYEGGHGISREKLVELSRELVSGA